MAESGPASTAGPGIFSPLALPPGQRWALRIEYDGSAFHGWQSQPHLPQHPTVQETLEAALAQIANTSIRTHCAGRTDTGVHATAQWIHFDSPVVRSAKAWAMGTNGKLPLTVRVADAHPVPPRFHARHSATARRYDYLIANTRTAPALLASRALWIRDPLDAARMHSAVQRLRGERDFSAFRAATCQSTTPMRFFESASVLRRGDYIQLRIIANAFLHHMVRNIVGSLIEVGLGEEDEDWLGALLAAGDRTLAGATAAAHGLYLTGVRYPRALGLPPAPTLPFFPSSAQDDEAASAMLTG